MDIIRGTLMPGARKVVLFALTLCCPPHLLVMAQTAAHASVATKGSGGNTFDGPADVRYVPHKDSLDRRVDLFFGDWRESTPRSTFGSLILRDILTRGDNLS